MRLSECAALLGVPGPETVDPEIAAVRVDSRACQPGDLFVAIDGHRADGRRFLGDAARRGAVAVVVSTAPDVADEKNVASGAPPIPALARLRVDDPRRAAGVLAEAFAGYPSRALRLVGVTGTNGKTTTAYVLRHLFSCMGERCGLLGTIEYDDGQQVRPAPLTTPDAVAFSDALAAMVRHGCRAAAVEASSHALDQGRVFPHRFSGAVFTNLTRDHLDYHGTMDAYADAKARLFASLDENAVAVVRADDPAAGRMVRDLRAPLHLFTLDPRADGADGAFGRMARPPARARRWRVRVEQTDVHGSSGTLEPLDDPSFSLPWRTTLAGAFNVENVVGALLTAWASGGRADDLRAALADFPGVPGRLERVDAPALPEGAAAFVDYAHTDDALRTVLATLRALAPGRRLTVVFGCGGDRDRGKRPLMAAAAEQGADRVVVTDDNPRTEDPSIIFDDIRKGFARPDAVSFIPGRAAAVAAAVRGLAPGDVLLVAGKGHEHEQIIGHERFPMDDRALIRHAMEG